MAVYKGLICLVACHGGPADHFATYAQQWKQQGYDVQIYASGPALDKFAQRQIEVQHPFDLTKDQRDELVAAIAKTSAAARFVLTDVGDPFTIQVQQTLQDLAVRNCCYYDNPESFVDGGHSANAAKVIAYAREVWFGNQTLATDKIFSALGQEIDLTGKRRVGIGYYPTTKATEVRALRETLHETKRNEFLERQGSQAEKVVVFFGGNNAVYFNEALPTFLGFLTEASVEHDLSSFCFVIQQHPLAKKNPTEASALEAWQEAAKENPNSPQILLSDVSSDEAQLIADVACYDQTTMNIQLVLAQIPTFWIAREGGERQKFPDQLVRSGVVSAVTESSVFVDRLTQIASEEALPPEEVSHQLGIREDWQAGLDSATNA